MWASILISVLSMIPGTEFPDSPNFGLRYAFQRSANGFALTNVDSSGLAAQIGLRTDDVFRTINGKEIKTEKDLLTALSRLSGEQDRVHIIVFRPVSDKNVEFRGVLRKRSLPDKKVGYLFLPADKDWKLDVKRIR